MRIEGFYTALVSPLKVDGKGIDCDTLKQLIARQIEAGVHGLILGGSTGEGQTLEWAELEELLKVGLSFKGKIQIWGACSFSGTAQTSERYQMISKLGVDGVLISSPAYNKPPQRGLIKHFEEIAKAASTPMMIYNIPGRTAVDIRPDTLAEISRIPQVVAIKESSGKLEQIKEVASKIAAQKVLLCGDDPLSLDVWKMGAKGTVSVLSNLLPKACVNLWKLWSAGNFNDAEALQKQLTKMTDLVFVESNPIPVKYAVGLLLKKNLKLRLPLVELDTKYHQGIRQELEVMANLGFCERL